MIELPTVKPPSSTPTSTTTTVRIHDGALNVTCDGGAAAEQAAGARASPNGSLHRSSNGNTNGSNGHGSPPQQQQLSVIMLATIVFYAVSGGPFGIEAAVRAGGAAYTLLGLLILPLAWSIPEAALTAELASTFPEAAGGVAWVEEAFGHRAGFMAGYLGWVAGATDNAIYPVLFLDYVWQGWMGSVTDGQDNNTLVSSNPHPILRFVLLAAMSILLAYINWLGLNVVGNMSVIICLVAMSPFIIMSVVGAFQVDHERWFRGPTEDLSVIEAVTDDDIGGGFFPNLVVAGVMWRPFLNNLFWNLNSFDSAASLSGDVSDPGAIYPRAMMYAVIMVVSGYLIPMAVALGASNAPQHAWVDGYLATIASELVGPWLGGWTVFAAGISNLALFQAELSTESFQLMGMAERGYVPAIFASRSSHGTPTYGILLGTAVVVALCTFDLATLIEMLNFNYSIALMMEYSSFIKLRISRPDVHRPWRVPLNTTGCILLFIPTFTVTLTLMSLANYSTYLFSIGTNCIGLLLYRAKTRGWWGTNEASHRSSPPMSDVSSKGEYNLVIRRRSESLNSEGDNSLEGHPIT
jgi:amino acid transporter